MQKSVSLLFVLGVLGGFYFYSKQVPGTAQPQLTLIDLRARPLFLPFKAHAVKKNYVHVWSIACAPCLEEIPWLMNWLALQNLSGLWIHVAENSKETNQAKAYIAQQKFTGEILYLSKNEARDLNLAGYPSHFLLDKNQRVAFEWTGRLEKIQAPFKKLWLQLLDEQASP